MIVVDVLSTTMFYLWRHKKMATDYYFSMVVGDWNKNGHGSTDTFFIECSHKRKEVEAAYNKACRDFGYDPISSLCEDTGENELPLDFTQKLLAQGFIFKMEDTTINPIDWVRIILFMAGTRLMDFGYSIKNNNSDVWNVGGYGVLGEY